MTLLEPANYWRILKRLDEYFLGVELATSGQYIIKQRKAISKLQLIRSYFQNHRKLRLG
jgi:hypothetical protein